MSDDTAGLLIALVAENADLRRQLSEAQDLLIETAIDAGALHGQIEALQAELAVLRQERSSSVGQVLLLPQHHGIPSLVGAI